MPMLTGVRKYHDGFEILEMRITHEHPETCRFSGRIRVLDVVENCDGIDYWGAAPSDTHRVDVGEKTYGYCIGAIVNPGYIYPCDIEGILQRCAINDRKFFLGFNGVHEMMLAYIMQGILAYNPGIKPITETPATTK